MNQPLIQTPLSATRLDRAVRRTARHRARRAGPRRRPQASARPSAGEAPSTPPRVTATTRRGEALYPTLRRSPHVRGSVAPVHRHDAGAAEAEVVLQRDLGVRHLALVGLAAQLPHELRALRERRWRRAGGPWRAGRPRGSSRPCRRRCSRASQMNFSASPSLQRPSPSYVRISLAVKQSCSSHDLHVLRAEARLLVDLLRRVHGHVVADHLDHALLEAGRVVGRHRLRGDPHRVRDARASSRSRPSTGWPRRRRTSAGSTGSG